MNIGDFIVSKFEQKFARDKQAARSERSRGVDAEERAPVTTDAGTWATNKDHLDFPGIDTPSENPGVLPKDLKHPAETETAPATRGRAEGRELPSAERNTTAPEPETAALAAQDISLSPEEAFEGVATGSQQPRDFPDRTRQFAGGGEADIAFIESEEERSRTDRDPMELL